MVGAGVGAAVVDEHQQTSLYSLRTRAAAAALSPGCGPAGLSTHAMRSPQVCPPASLVQQGHPSSQSGLPEGAGVGEGFAGAGVGEGFAGAGVGDGKGSPPAASHLHIFGYSPPTNPAAAPRSPGCGPAGLMTHLIRAPQLMPPASRVQHGQESWQAPGVMGETGALSPQRQTSGNSRRIKFAAAATSPW